MPDIRVDTWKVGMNTGRPCILVEDLLGMAVDEVVKTVYNLAQTSGVTMIVLLPEVMKNPKWEYVHSCLIDPTLGLQLQTLIDLGEMGTKYLEKYTEFVSKGFQWVTVSLPKGMIFPTPKATEVFFHDPPEGKCPLPRTSHVPFYHVVGEGAMEWIMGQELPSEWILG